MEERYKLHLGDCLEVLKTLESGSVDAVITDPPYGIGEASGRNVCGAGVAPRTDYGVSDWDDQTADEAVRFAVAKAHKAVVFGGNYYDLPPTSCWLVWDKVNGENSFADCELAWTNLKQAVRLKRHMWHGMLRKGREPRSHPTQKPLEVMRWCIQQCKLPEGSVILDPFMGSGTTGVAALQMGCKFIGCEIEPKYFEIAKRRIEAEARQRTLDFGGA